MSFIRKSLLLGILCSFALSAQGQLNYKKGWVVNSAGDTIHGLINDAGGMRNSRVCTFRKSMDHELSKYRPEDLKSYMLIGDSYYVSREIEHNNKRVQAFLEVVIEGRIKLFRYNISAVYYMEKEGHELSILKNDHDPQEQKKYIYPVKWDSYKLGTYVYKDTLYSFFKDCVPVLNELDIVEYNRKSLVDITKKYLRLTSQDDQLITYERSKESSRAMFGVYSGISMSKMLFYDYIIDSEITTSVPVGVLYDIPITPISRNLSVQVGVNASMIDYGYDFINQTTRLDSIRIKSTAVGIPISFNYSLHLNRFSPYIGFGKETAFVVRSASSYNGQRYDDMGVLGYGQISTMLHKIQKGGWFADLGFKYNVSQDFAVFANVRVQQYFNLMIEDASVSNITFSTAADFWNTFQLQTYHGSLRIGIMF